MNATICPVHQAAMTNPAGIAYRFDDRTITFLRFEESVDTAARRLLSLAVSRGDRVAVLSENSIAVATLVFALPRIGASLVPLNLRLRAEDWQYQCRQANVALILCDQAHCHQVNQLDIRVLVIDNSEGETSLEKINLSEPQAATQLDSQQETTLIFTSGSGGKPKGVILSYANHYFNALGSNENIRLQAGDCWLLSLPLYHVGGLSILYRSMLAGTTVYITAGFTADETNRLIDRGAVTHLSLVPTQLHRLLESRRTEAIPLTLKVILLGGAPAPQGLIEKIKKLSLPVLMTYGMTETASQVTTMSLDDSPKRLTTVGRSLKYRQVHIIDKSNRELPTNSIGEIAVSGEVLGLSYLDGQLTSDNESDWFRTGDLGYLDDDGYLVVKGRIDDMFISGGENVHPAEIISVAEAYPSVNAAAVIAITNQTWGQRPLLFIETAKPEQFDKKALLDFLQRRLARLKVPDDIIALTELPRTAIGKIDRAALREYHRKIREEEDN